MRLHVVDIWDLEAILQNITSGRKHRNRI